MAFYGSYLADTHKIPTKSQNLSNSPVNSPHNGQWRAALMSSLICTWINGSVYHRETVDLRRRRAHYDVTVMMASVYVTRPQRANVDMAMWWNEINYDTQNKLMWQGPSVHKRSRVATMLAPQVAIAGHSCNKTATMLIPPFSNINTLRPRQNGRHFADDIFKLIFLNENV